MKTIAACYDLDRCPPTYDVVAFLALLEQHRITVNADHVELYIKPGRKDGFRADYLWPHTLDARRRMRDRVLVPLCTLLPSVTSVGPDKHPPSDAWGIGTYSVGLPAILTALKAGIRPLRAPSTRQYVGQLGVPYITMTLREAEHHPLRNSRVSEWMRAAEQLADDIPVIVIRDTAQVTAPLPLISSTCLVMPARRAAINVVDRADVYAEALVNVGVSNGPMWMSIFMDAPTLMLRPTTNAAKSCFDDRFFTRHGLPPGSQLPTSPPHQRLVWEDDTADNIVRAVREMMQCQTV